jgi:outer membrane protein OmpA-like peptidoglycan-associated protein
MTQQSSKEEAEQLAQLRLLLFGEDNQQIRDIVAQDARKIVGNILAEALKDRQANDGAIGQVLAPIVEKSVEHTITTRKDQFIGYMYPLVGKLVRKSVSAFLTHFLEQTNQLLESSFTLKGIAARYKAWRSGMSYSQYIISQTYSFRVEQVLLIHSETSMLLKTVAQNTMQTTDADMVSAMLSAISDFVSDSFTNSDTERQQLDEIKTDNFTLLIKQGPQAIIVAAITGNVPANIGEKLQISLENIHKIYGEELHNFDGDASPFDGTALLLNECLVTTYHKDSTAHKKSTWMAILLLFSLASLAAFFLFKQWQLNEKLQRIQLLKKPPGIILLTVETCDNNICMTLLRDPMAEPIASWLNNNHITINNMNITERTYRSADAQLNQQRLSALQKQFPELTLNNEKLTYSGELTRERFTMLNNSIAPLADMLDIKTVLADIEITKPMISISEQEISRILIEQKIKKIEQTSISFNRNESKLTTSAQANLIALSKDISSVIKLSAQFDYSIQIIIIGTSDSSGTSLYNQRISTKRAQSVNDALVNNGVQQHSIQTVGFGSMEGAEETRRVMFSVIKVVHKTSNPANTIKVQE